MVGDRGGWWRRTERRVDRGEVYEQLFLLHFRHVGWWKAGGRLNSVFAFFENRLTIVGVGRIIGGGRLNSVFRIVFSDVLIM